MNRGLVLSINTGAFVFGVVMASLGALLPALFQSIGFQKADAGDLFLAMNFGMLVGSVAFGPICDRFGYKAVLLAGTLLISGAFGVLSQVSAYGFLPGILAALGLGGGVLNGAANALTSDISAERRQSALNLLGIYFGLGALLTPLFIGAGLGKIGLQWVLYSFVIITLAPFALFLVASYPAPKHQQGLSWRAMGRVIGHPLLILFGLMLFCQSGNEFVMGGWVSSYLGERFGMSPRISAYVLAGYWTALMFGRLIASRFAGRLAASTIVIISALLSMAAAVGLILAADPISAGMAVALAGLGFAAVFPTVLAQVGAAFSEYSGTAFGLIFVLALSGGMLAPWSVGRIAQTQGIGSGIWLVAVACAVIALLQAWIRARYGRRS
jgi:fucose permease